MCVSLVLSHVWLFLAPWTVALQAPMSMEFFKQEVGFHFLLQGELPNPLSSALQVDALPLNHWRSLNISVLYPIWNDPDSHEFSSFNFKLPKSGQTLLNRHNYFYQVYLKGPFFFCFILRNHRLKFQRSQIIHISKAQKKYQFFLES